MRTVVVEQFGDPDQLTLRTAADPQPEAGEVLIGVRSVGVNRADLLARAGKYHRAGPPPLVLGLECAGTVLAVGDGVTDLSIGDRVVAFCATNEPGFYADMAVVPRTSVVPIVGDVDLRAAACLPTAWLSAWYCLHRLAGIQPGQTVLIHAAASGVGSAAVSIAVDAGAVVLGTAGSDEKVSWAQSLGARQVFNTGSGREAVLAAVAAATDGAGPDVVLDTVGGDSFADSVTAVGYGGRVIAMANVALQPSVVDTRSFYPKNVSIHGFQITALIEHGYDPRPDLELLLAGVAAGRFSVLIAATFDLMDAAAAHRLLEGRGTQGKVVLTVDP